MNTFEGYYIKVAQGEKSFAVIFGRNRCGRRHSFIQIVTLEKSFKFDFDYKNYSAKQKPFLVRVGNNRADTTGLYLDIDIGGTRITADFAFEKFSPPRYNAMGIFKYFPFMECKHKVISMTHGAKGSIVINGIKEDFNGIGYIEGDAGRSFPDKYFWTQSNIDKETSVMVSCARIPYLGLKFIGTICIVHLNGREYRLATYLGARVKIFLQNEILIEQRKLRLEIKVHDAKNLRDLSAPTRGEMKRIIKETVTASISFKLFWRGKIILNKTVSAALEQQTT